MPTSSINLGLPQVPETGDEQLFKELIRIYNALNILAQALDAYTGSGTVTNSVSSITSATTSAVNGIDRKIAKLNTIVKALPDSSATLNELRKAYYKYKLARLEVVGDTVLDGKLDVALKAHLLNDLQVAGSTTLDADLTVGTTLTVTGAGGFNGASPQVRIATASGGSAPASGAGTLAGAFDTAGNRDAAIAAINANSHAIDTINNLLHDWGLRT